MVNIFASDNLLSGFQVLASGLRNLEELYLTHNKLNDIILSSLGGFSTLKSLYLSNNRFTGSTGLNGKVVNHSYLGWHSLARFNN
jgi:Leucine-rich repeat (LRR) protein